MLVTSFLTREFSYHCKRTSDSSWYLIGYLVQHGQSKHMYDKSAIFTLWCMLSSIVAYFTYLRLDSDKFQRDSHVKNAREDKTKYRTEYTIEWHVLKKSTKSNFHTFCEACKCEVSVQYGPYRPTAVYGGTDDCHWQWHVSSTKHWKDARWLAEQI